MLNTDLISVLRLVRAIFYFVLLLTALSLAGSNSALASGTTTIAVFSNYDAFLRSGDNTIWNFIRDGRNVQFDDTLSSRADFRLSDWYYSINLHRYHSEFDTSQIDPEDEIVSATLRLYFDPAVTGNLSPNNGWVVVSSDVTGSTTDQKWDSFTAAIDSAYSEQTRLDSAGYIDFVLNEDGIEALNRTGTTKLGLVNYWDYINTDPTSAYGPYKSDSGTLYLRNNTGTSSDPVLIVETVSLNSSPTAPSDLQTEGLTNPTDVTDPTPEFSAVYEDPDIDDIATHYQIQVDDSTSFSSPVWDSGSSTLASSTTEGVRIGDVSYGGAELTPNLTYYWRIKFWDDEGLEGDWSNYASFDLASATSTATITSGYDAFLKSSDNTSWSYIRQGQNVQFDDTLSSRADFRLSDWYHSITLHRYHADFDTSYIASEDEIVSATLRLYFDPVVTGNFSSNNGWVVVPSDITGSTADQKWDSFTAAIDSAYSEQVRLSNAGYIDFQLNEDGIGSINRAGTTSLGVVPYWDYINTDPTSAFGPYSSDRGTLFLRSAAGTSTDPVLIIETASSTHNPTAPTSPTGLETEGQTNPVDVTDPTPEFSAVYEDPDIDDIATHYQIQVDDSTSFSSPVWDTGSTTLSSPVTEGNRMGEVSYGGIELTSNSTYYWRIKFWDEESLEGEWSSYASFDSATIPSTTAIFSSYDATLQPMWDYSWATMRDGSSVTISSTSATSTPDFRLSDWYNGITLYRYYSEFDTSQIDPEGEIVSATLRLYFDPVVTGNFSSNNGWVVVPGDMTGSTTDQKWDSFTAAMDTIYSEQTRLDSTGYIDFILNEDGIEALNRTGITELGLVNYWDYINTDPNQSYGPYSSDRGTLVLRNNTGTSSDPVLIVETE